MCCGLSTGEIRLLRGVTPQVRNSHNAKSHQEPDGNFTPDLDLDVPEQQDGKGGADEIGRDGEDYPDVFSYAFRTVPKHEKTYILERLKCSQS